MGHCSSTPSERSFVRNQDINPRYPEETASHADDMDERSDKTDFNSFLEVNNAAVMVVKEKFERFDALRKEFCELKALNERIMKENESLRQRYGKDGC